jgi:hypothetical protein
MRIPLRSVSAMFRGLRLPSLVSTPRDGPYRYQTRSQTSRVHPSVAPPFAEHAPCAQDINYFTVQSTNH